MTTTRVAAAAVLVLLLCAGGVFALRSWVGIDAGEQASGRGGRSSASPSPGESAGAPGAEATPSPSATPAPSVAPSPDPSPTPSRGDTSTTPTTGPQRERGAELASTDGIARDIAARLDRSGRATSVSCPPSVPSAVGTTFLCAVSYAASPQETVADARVAVVGPGMRYVWRSLPR